MFKVNDYVMYGSTGACKVIDITKEKYLNMGNEEVEFYVLQTVFNNGMTIKIPVDNTKVSIRKVIEKEDALSLISSLQETKTDWISDDRKRNTTFKSSLKSGDCKDYLEIIKTIYIRKKEQTAEGKKLKKTDEEIMKTAEKHLYEEFSIALGIPTEEVEKLIFEKL